MVPPQKKTGSSHLNSDINRVRNWMQTNQLTLNIKKSKFMLIGGHSHLNSIDSTTISTDGNLLEKVNSI